MFTRMRWAGLTVWLAAALAGPVAAKPPDLPVDLTVQCKPEVLDAVPIEVPQAPAAALGDIRLRQLFQIGERCRRDGDWDMACNCYHEIQRISPHSRLGQRAQARLRTIASYLKNPPGDEEACEEQDEGALSEQQVMDELLEKAGRLRQQTGEPPVCPCPFRKLSKPARWIGIGPAATDAAGQEEQAPDKPMSDTDTQKLLEDTEPLEIYLDDAVAASEQGQLMAARQLFQVAEDCCRSGNLDMALSCYEETHRICPDSRYGRSALQKLEAIKRQQSSLQKRTDSAGRPIDLTVAPPPRDLVVEEESEPNETGWSQWSEALHDLMGCTCIEVDIDNDGWRAQGTICLDTFCCKIVKNKQGGLEVIFTPEP